VTTVPACHAPDASALPASAGRQRPLVALAGNPNTGKSTLFNRLTGSRVRVGNYPGVTTERRSGLLQIDDVRELELVDVPGTYSLVARSADEQVAIDALLGLGGNRRPDLAVLCVDATQLLRNLYLVLQVQEMGLPLLIALTMMDEAGPSAPEPSALERLLGCKVVPTVARDGIGVPALARAIEQCLAEGPPAPAAWRWKPSEPLARAIAEVRAALPAGWPASDGLALWALMSVDPADELEHIPGALRQVVLGQEIDGEALDDEVVQARYRWLDAEAAPLLRGEPDRSWTTRADRVLIHPVWGFAVFLALMFVLFQSLFAWADPAVTLVEAIFGWLGAAAASALPAGVLTDLLVEGVIGGLGSVIVFLPQILLLFFLLGLMEDSGYLARVAYLMDRVMRAMRLHGRAFVPMLSGFACAIPAILATRTMERRRDRFLTMMVVPLMTCSARLPVYTLIIGALFPSAVLLGFVPVQGALMVGMYLFSTLVALFAAWVLSRTVFRSNDVPFLLELPPYRLPRLGDVVRMMWEKSRLFLTEAGTIILACTVVLWALLSFPKDVPYTQDFPAAIEAAASEEEAAALESRREGEQLRHSYAGRMGQALEPALRPLGFDWKIGIGIVGAFAAREVFVSTLGVVYNVGKEADEESTTLRRAMREELREDGRRLYTPLVGLTLMIFFALACQCMSTLAVVKRETRSWRWPIFLFVYMTVLAWGVSFVVYQGGRLLGFE
jgi:ferrous iron transport protein B